MRVVVARVALGAGTMHGPGGDRPVALSDVARNRRREIDAIGFLELVRERDLPVAQDARVAPTLGALNGVGERLCVCGDRGATRCLDAGRGDVFARVAFAVVMDGPGTQVYQPNAEAIRERGRGAMATGPRVSHHVDVANRHFQTSRRRRRTRPSGRGGCRGGLAPLTTSQSTDC